MTTRKRTRKKARQNVVYGRVYVQSTFNNTVVTITDRSGNVLAWNSGGTEEFKGSKKSTAFAAQLAAQKLSQKANDFGIQEVEIFVKGPGAGRDSAIRAISNSGIKVKSIRDVTPVPHNGCRPPKRRRV
ncbi:MAG: 30S ribosomal protein S11 [Chloroflexi bacterium]|nr:30S ribosomal protein S11 [Chloroflexota bacterium]|tara:strand:- start:428 stop:814 length:387 start_codon:yes stop_codon:yes gene_type:complete